MAKTNRSFQAFLNSDLRNAWCVKGPFKFYVRRGLRFLNGERLKVIDLATIDSSKPGSGKLGELFTELEQAAKDYDGLFVENVLNRRLCSWLERRGYIKAPGPDEAAPCYLRLSRITVTYDKGPGWDWTLTYQDEEGVQTMTVFGVKTIDEALEEGRRSFHPKFNPDGPPTFISVTREG